MSKQTSKLPFYKRVGKNRLYLSIACVSIVLITFSVFNLVFYFSSNKNQVLGTKIELDTKTTLINQRIFWKELLKENPRYIYGWVELAKVEVQLENPKAARNALNFALEINPNSQLVKDAEKNLGFLNF